MKLRFIIPVFPCRTSSIKEVIDRNKGDEKVCDERDGWCLPHTTDDLRDIISGLIKKVVRAQKPSKEQPGREEHPHAVGQINHPVTILDLNASWRGELNKESCVQFLHSE